MVEQLPHLEQCKAVVSCSEVDKGRGGRRPRTVYGGAGHEQTSRLHAQPVRGVTLGELKSVLS